MLKTLNEICKEIHNYFETSKYFGTFVITNGEIDLSELVYDGSLQEGQYFRIIGSVFNDGIYQYPTSDLTDEIFKNGAVWALAIPTELIDLAAEIDTWNEKNDSILNSPFQSESFGGYSYTKASGNSSTSGDNVFTWRDQFSDRLNPWRKAKCRY